MVTTIITATVTSVIAALITTASGLYLAKKRFEREQRLDFQVETLVHSLLSHDKWRLRTFKTIEHHVGGFKDDELRKILLQAGALRFEDRDGMEVWGLLERNQDLLIAEIGTSAN